MRGKQPWPVILGKTEESHISWYIGGMIGVMVLPLISCVNLTKIIGWRHVWLVASLSILIFFLPLLFLVFTRSKHSGTLILLNPLKIMKKEKVENKGCCC